MMKRGVVSLPSVIYRSDDKGGIKVGNILSIIDLNYFALYWDELIIPSNGLVNIAINGEEQFIQAGFLQRPRPELKERHYMNPDVFSMYVDAQTHILDIKRREEPASDWRINIIGDSFRISDNDSELKKTFRIELSRVLPVPGPHVHIQDILDFKVKRKDEFLAFSNYLDELYLEVVSSGDFDLSKAKAFSKLQQSIYDLEKINNEGWRSPIRFDTSALFEANNGDLITGASALYSIWEAHQGDLMGAISAGVVALIGQGFARLKPSIQSVRRSPGKNIAYLSSAHKSSILK
ncbi:DUF6236 family protein [Klebsiella pneumoniae]|uniref:DUF6236 family protein n=1 Tax=Klebsiella pneumoniae TaxID=573 RepID=UPI00065127B6|nr:DUF6236 family protein [Klebsiella pneumoniae]MCQ0885223.1 DUF6236 family protein [Klebsiella pneumoniae]MDU9067232.1 DUF6236 family protein [Klebsiella pneumoniae]MDU9078149.1 DUF6236 family protein [Klebsiella pneumoniae]MEA4490221.1 DUF6236 family protein [Klebsiella pneumoniae]